MLNILSVGNTCGRSFQDCANMSQGLFLRPWSQGFTYVLDRFELGDLFMYNMIRGSM